MEARYHKQKKLTTKPVPVNPKKELLVRRKSLGHNLRYLAERKKTDLPPLTPLHRLRRFKAIRDKNLKTKLKKTISRKAILKMEEANQINQIESETEASTVEKDSESSSSLKTKLHQEKLEMGSNLFLITEEKVSNGHTGTENGHNSSEDIHNSTQDVHNGTKDVHNGIEDEHNCIKEHHASDFNGTENVPTSTNEIDVEVEVEIDVVEDEIPSNDMIETQQGESEREKSVESDQGSSSSNSTSGSSSIGPHTSSVGLACKIEQVSDDGEIDIESLNEPDQVSPTEYERQSVSSSRAEEKQEASGSKGRLTSRIPRRVSSTGSASSYKTAYGSLRIGGRRPITSRGMKRKSEEEESEEVRASPSLPSPRWRFFSSSVSRLWSPSLSDALSPSSTPLRSVDDSMAVNLNEDSINSHLNDPDLFSEMKPPASKKPRWGCCVM